MRHLERIRSLLCAVGSVIDVFVIDEYPDEMFWHIALDAETIFFAEIDEDRGLLVLSADVGSPTAERKGDLYELLLNYNHHKSSTSGVHLSLHSPGGAVWLWSEIAVERLDRETMAAWMDDYRRKLRSWRKIVAEAGRSTAAVDEPPPFFETSMFIRG